MPLIPKLWDLTGGALLMRSGAAGRLTTIGRVSGEPRTVQTGFLALPDGSLLVGSVEGREWPKNLEAAGWCTFQATGLPERRYAATRLIGEARLTAVAQFRAARGSQASRMFSDPVFKLTPVS